MSSEPAIDIDKLGPADARDLAPLLAAYVQALKRGAPRAADQYYAQQLLEDRAAEFLGARIDGELVGFILYYDLPDPVTGMRAGLADHLYVHHARRGDGIAKALVDVLADQGAARGWSRLMLNAPRKPDTGRRVFEAVAAPADWHSFVLDFRND
jgi:GNAT superfamily N-acetyltransferase